MIDINEQLRGAARKGSTLNLKDLMNESGCNVLGTDNDGMTALMWAAYSGHSAAVSLTLCKSDALVQDNDGLMALMWAACGGDDACVRLLLPVSDILAFDQVGETAATHAKGEGYEILAQFIDAYTMAQSEQADIEVAAGPGAACNRVPRRI